jgi:hypothetical protein
LLTFLWRSLQENPNNRYESAAEMGAAIDSALGERPAVPATIGAFVSELFPVEKKFSVEEGDAWRLQFSAKPKPAVEKTGVTVSVAEKAAKPGPRPTMVIDRSAKPSRRWIVALTGVVTALFIAEVIWLLHKRSMPQQPAPPIAVAPPQPHVVVAPAPPAPVQPATEPVQPPSAPQVRPYTPESVKAPTKTAPIEPLPKPHVEPVEPTVSLASLNQQMEQAKRLMQGGQTNSARTILVDISKDERIRPQAKTMLADLELRVGHYEQAISIASEAIRIAGGADAYFTRASAELSEHRFADAERDFNKVLSLEPTNEDAKEGLKRAQQLTKVSP